MKLSEAIRMLTAAHKTHGDLDVTTFGAYYTEKTLVSGHKNAELYDNPHGYKAVYTLEFT